MVRLRFTELLKLSYKPKRQDTFTNSLQFLKFVNFLDLTTILKFGRSPQIKRISFIG
jgi:hypothetical protein